MRLAPTRVSREVAQQWYHSGEPGVQSERDEQRKSRAAGSGLPESPEQVGHGVTRTRAATVMSRAGEMKA